MHLFVNLDRQSSLLLPQQAYVAAVFLLCEKEPSSGYLRVCLPLALQHANRFQGLGNQWVQWVHPPARDKHVVDTSNCFAAGTLKTSC
jgi:hypothetical protein